MSVNFAPHSQASWKRTTQQLVIRTNQKTASAHGFEFTWNDMSAFLSMVFLVAVIGYLFVR